MHNVFFCPFSAENSYYNLQKDLSQSTFFDKMTTIDGNHEKIKEIMENHENLTTIVILTTYNVWGRNPKP